MGSQERHHECRESGRYRLLMLTAPKRIRYLGFLRMNLPIPFHSKGSAPRLRWYSGRTKDLPISSAQAIRCRKPAVEIEQRAGVKALQAGGRQNLVCRTKTVAAHQLTGAAIPYEKVDIGWSRIRPGRVISRSLHPPRGMRFPSIFRSPAKSAGFVRRAREIPPARHWP